MPSKQLHIKIDDALHDQIEQIREHMSPKPSKNALVAHILWNWANPPKIQVAVGQPKEDLSDD